MKLLTTFLLVGLLALWMGFPSEAQKIPIGRVCNKRGICPLAACYCPQGITEQCCSDHDCPLNQKCCLICCTRRCSRIFK